MNSDENKKHRKPAFRNCVIRVFLVQLSVIFFLIIIDLYLFRGYYTSRVIITSGYDYDPDDYTYGIYIKKGKDDKYIIKFKNYSLFPRYLRNYRNDELIQHLTDTIFFNQLGGNLFPAYGTNYSYDFGCGTGLGLTGINPYESFKIEKSYKDIIKEFSSSEILANSMYLYESSPSRESFNQIDYDEIDSLIESESQHVLATDSVKIEYYINMYSFVSRNPIRIISNRINVSVKDLIDEYMNKRNKKN